VSGNETVGGTLSVTEATTLSSLSVTGNETVGGTLSVIGNETVTGTLSVTDATTLSSLSVTGNETIGGTLSVTEATTLSSLSVSGNETVSGTLSVTEATTLSSLSVIGNETVGGTLGVTNTTTLTGNVGIGGASGTENLLVTGSERITGNLDVSGGLNVNGNINLNTNTYFDTIVIRRLNESDTTHINLNELQVWVNGSNILFLNSASLTGYFAIWANKQIDIGSDANNSPVSLLYNNIFDSDSGPMTISPGGSAAAIIIKNIPLTSINEIQAIVLYNRITSSQRAIGLFFELYNSTNDPNLTEVLANTNVITSSALRYRYNFPSLSTYTGSFATANSTTNIVSNSIASTEEANVILMTDLTVIGNILNTGNIQNDKFKVTQVVTRLSNLYNGAGGGEITIANNVGCSGGTLIFYITLQGRVTNPGLYSYIIRYKNTAGATLATISAPLLFNQSDVHQAWGITQRFTGIPAANMLVSIERSSTDLRMDGNDFITIVMEELPY